MIRKKLVINGVARDLVLDGSETLAKLLRERLLLTGCKIGCGEGHCGACNVIVDGKVTRSCVTKVTRLKDNAEITTIEGIGTLHDMHPLQVAWMANGCAQCGFCAPGFIMSGIALLNGNCSPTGNKPIYKITYEDCCNMVNRMEDSFRSDVFGIEKEVGKVEGILVSIYQSAFGEDVYPSLEEKAANLLYFMIKDHPYADGCKRIAASLFLEFLARNDALYNEGQKRISDGALVAITLMIAESDPKEKDIMVNLVMNLLII